MLENKHDFSNFNSYFQDPLAAQLSTGGRARTLASPDERIICLSELGTIDVEPHYTSGCRINAEHFKKFLTDTNWICRRISKNLFFGEGKLDIDSTVETWINKERGILLNMTVNHLFANTQIPVDVGGEDYMIEIKEKENLTTPIISALEIYTPVDKRSVLVEYLAEMFDMMVKLHHEPTRESTVGIISHDGDSYYVKSFSLAGKIPDFVHVDEHYGSGFGEFHSKMIDRIKTETKGLILFHGEPGTGKTQYIRMLLDQLTRINKSILYVPPGFSDQLTDPMMIEFISEWVMDEDRDCILLIEDAEPLLETRNGADGRSTGISNLLNMTDGILNDMLGLMVIAIFNTSISKIDSALLRPQRLIARKEFGRMGKEQATQLASALNIELPNIEYPATLAEFYANKKGHDVLLHTVTQERKIGFSK